MVRGNIWQGIRNWLKPVSPDSSVGAPASATPGCSTAESTGDEWPPNVVPLVHGAARTRSLIDAAHKPIPKTYSSSNITTLKKP